MDISVIRNAMQVASTANKKATATDDPVSTNPAADDFAESVAPNLKINDLKAGAVAASGLDQEKVDRIANAIQNGRYNINTQRIAEKMVAAEFDLP